MYFNNYIHTQVIFFGISDVEAITAHSHGNNVDLLPSVSSGAKGRLGSDTGSTALLPLIQTVRLLLVTYESVLSNYSARYYALLEGTQKRVTNAEVIGN